MTVVCGVDGTTASRVVARYAADVAARAGAPLKLVRAVQVGDPLFLPAAPYRSVPDPAEQREKVLERANRQLDEAKAELSGEPVEVTTELRQDAPADAVLASAREHAAKLVVVGTRGAGGLLGAAGSVARRVMRRADCPVVVVPPEYPRRMSERPVLLSGIRGGDPHDAAVAARRAAEVARALGAELVLGHVSRESDGRRGAGGAGATTASPASDHSSWIAEVPEGARVVTAHGTPVQELMRLAVEVEADAVVVAPRGHGPVRQALLGSVSSGLLAAAELPIIVIPRVHGS